MFGAYRQQITDDKWTGLIIELNNHVGTGLYPVTVMNEQEIMGQWDIPQLLPIFSMTTFRDQCSGRVIEFRVSQMYL